MALTLNRRVNSFECSSLTQIQRTSFPMGNLHDDDHLKNKQICIVFLVAEYKRHHAKLEHELF